MNTAALGQSLFRALLLGVGAAGLFHLLKILLSPELSLLLAVTVIAIAQVHITQRFSRGGLGASLAFVAILATLAGTWTLSQFMVLSSWFELWLCVSCFGLVISVYRLAAKPTAVGRGPLALFVLLGFQQLSILAAWFALLHSHSVFLAFWCYLLADIICQRILQSLERRPGTSGESSPSNPVSDFEQAQKTAEQALRSIL